jgi:hypothetical protein
MKKRSKRGKRSLFGRVLEGLADVLLLLIILAFGISIATHFLKRDRSVRTAAVPTGGTVPVAGDERAGAGRPGAREAEASAAAGEGTVRPVSAEELRSRPAVDIRNGSGRPGLAETIALRMRGAHFDVLEYRNADRYDYEQTLIKERGNKPQAAQAARSWLQKEYGVGRVEKDPKLTTAGDVLIILGTDLADTLRQRERSTR